MQNYLIAYYTNNEPWFVYSESVEAARLRAMNMVGVHANAATDILSIIEIDTDRIVFYGKGEKLLARLNGLGRAVTTERFSIPPFLKPVFTWIGLIVNKFSF
ncbi:hypothetical protein WBJ53_06565 [Spirosoma sp. SC4-14]|uniref:hypothetical protein n=1 Tax=Spirosoma sp. SC4-14 TaxID=3128900 RepID=UPI0030CB1BFC